MSVVEPQLGLVNSFEPPPLYAEQAQYDGLQVVDSAVTWEAIYVRQPN